jgi:SAM-dependent methyltransferase
VKQFETPSIPFSLATASRDQLVEWYWRRHPRFNFFKNVAAGGCVLDLGVGGGGLPFWREYLEPARTDIRMFGVDLNRPATATLYERFEVANLDASFPFPDLRFDAVIASHLLEHVADPGKLLGEVASCLRAGGRAYIETPTPESKSLPKAQEYRAKGWPMMISNFHDDGTHRDTFPLEQLIEIAATHGLEAIEAGYVSSPFLEDALIARGIEWGDSEMLLYGYWSRTAWAQFAIFERESEP